MWRMLLNKKCGKLIMLKKREKWMWMNNIVEHFSKDNVVTL